jgi:hypothetical protein
MPSTYSYILLSVPKFFGILESGREVSLSFIFIFIDKNLKLFYYSFY